MDENTRRKPTKLTKNIRNLPPELSQELSPEVEYNGGIEGYEDSLDYVKLTLKGVRLG